MINGYFALPALILGRHFFDQYEKLTLELNGPLFFVGLINSIVFLRVTKDKE